MLKEFIEVAKVGDLANGEMKAVAASGTTVLLARVDDRYYAVGNDCTHIAMPLNEGILVGCEVECPLHSSRFDLRTGAALCPPAEEPLPVYAVRIVGDAILVGPREQVERHLPRGRCDTRAVATPVPPRP